MSTSLSNLPTSGQSTGGDRTTGIRYPKDYNLIAINMLGAGTPTLDLKPSMTELSYFEDIYSNVASGQLMITDAMGIIEKLSMHGNEYIRIAFGKDDNPDITIDRLFRIYKISSRQKTSGFDSEAYVIHFCSDELIVSEQYKVSKSYKNKKISDIVNDICKVYLKVPKTKTTNIEITKGLHSFIVPNFKPLEAINWLALYARSKANVGSDMLFFEDKNGFNFASLQTLFGKTPYFTYEYRPKNIATQEHGEDKAKEIFNVLGYEVSNSFDTMQGISHGTFASRLITIDPLLRRHDKIDFNYAKYHSTSKSLNDNPVVNNLKNRFGHALYDASEGCLKMSFTNKGHYEVDYIKKKPGSVPNDIFSETFMSQRKAQLALANYTRMKFFIAGDPNVTVGMTINFNMLTQNPATKDDPKSPDKLYSGKYLITAVRHMIQAGGYNTVVEVIKESLPNALDSVNNSDQIWKNTVAGIFT